MKNRTFYNLVRKINFIDNINKSSIGHCAVLKQEEESGEMRVLAKVSAMTRGERPRRFSVKESSIPSLPCGGFYTLSGIENSILKGQMLQTQE